MKLLKLSLVALSLCVAVACSKKSDDPQPPTITGLSATTGNANASITINGTNFSATIANNTVKFGTVQAEVTAATATVLTVKVPNGSTKGKVSVKVGTFTEAISTNDFTTTSFQDTRDNQEYGQVYVGSQLWMARNLNWDAPSNDYCYNDAAAKCTQYGKLYLWDAATTACPNGWRLPSETDFNTLITTLGGAAAAKTALVGINSSSGLGVLYTGARTVTNTYISEGTRTLFYSSTEDSPNTNVKALDIESTSTSVIINSPGKTPGLCVRCIKN
jgi:uncharacterized protein (TIGR02145 family)